MMEIERVRTPTLDDIKALQVEVLKLPQIEPITHHYFADGMYLRTLRRKKGSLIVGKVHRKEHFFVLIEGELTVVTENSVSKKIKAPYVWVSKPGTKRVTYAHEDSTAMTVHQVSSKDLNEIEKELVEDDPSSLFGPGNVPLENAIELKTCPSS